MSKRKQCLNLVKIKAHNNSFFFRSTKEKTKEYENINRRDEGYSSFLNINKRLKAIIKNYSVWDIACGPLCLNFSHCIIVICTLIYL